MKGRKKRGTPHIPQAWTIPLLKQNKGTERADGYILLQHYFIYKTLWLNDFANSLNGTPVFCKSWAERKTAITDSTLYIKQQSLNNTANCLLYEAAYTLYTGVFHLLDVIPFKVHLISFKPIRKARPSLGRFSRNSQYSTTNTAVIRNFTQIELRKFKVREILTHAHTHWLSLRPFPQNLNRPKHFSGHRLYRVLSKSDNNV
jgi:hypothetical protein